jgi:2-keto-4-pentenoate hydratase/2-oxohepta-3-ene-1,7-dioic acid hydratase in catechol pathway
MHNDLRTERPRVVAFEAGGRHVGVAFGSRVHDVTDHVPDIASAVALTSSQLLVLTKRSGATFELRDIRLLPPVDATARIFCLALNYRAHADESGGADPGRPVIFHKLDTSLIGPFDDIVTPGYTEFLDYEAELAILIGRAGRRVPQDHWREIVGGYTVMNDVSCRDAQPTKLGDQTIIDWFSAKAADETTPVGPWVVPADEIDDPHALRVSLKRNGEVLQDASSSLMIFRIPRIIEFVSERVSLRPGDLIATGTPGGVGKARGIRLLPGDFLETEVSGIGRLANRVIEPRRA